MYLQLFDGNFLVAEIRCNGKLVVESKDDTFSPDESKNLRDFLSQESLSVSRNGLFIGTYFPEDPDYLIGAKIVLEQDQSLGLTINLVIDDYTSIGEFIRKASLLPFQRRWRMALELLIATRDGVGLSSDRVVGRVIDTLEKGEKVRLADLMSLLIRYSNSLEDEDDIGDEWKEAYISALIFLVPANPDEALLYLSKVVPFTGISIESEQDQELPGG